MAVGTGGGAHRRPPATRAGTPTAPSSGGSSSTPRRATVWATLHDPAADRRRCSRSSGSGPPRRPGRRPPRPAPARARLGPAARQPPGSRASRRDRIRASGCGSRRRASTANGAGGSSRWPAGHAGHPRGDVRAVRSLDRASWCGLVGPRWPAGSRRTCGCSRSGPRRPSGDEPRDVTVDPDGSARSGRPADVPFDAACGATPPRAGGRPRPRCSSSCVLVPT